MKFPRKLVSQLIDKVLSQPTGRPSRRSRPSATPTPPPPPFAPTGSTQKRPGPATSRDGLVTEYAPKADGRPDPGEVVWGWVPYEEDASQGKDRPVLIIARRGETLLALMLTSKDHDRDAADEARRGRHWMDVGSGGWDRQGRPSEVRLDRLIELDESAVRREGAAMSRGIFDEVVAAAADFH